MVASSHALLGLLCLGLRFQAVAATCYFPDGTTANDTPCSNDDDDETACCGTGYACYGSSSLYYLCQATGNELLKSGSAEFVRGSCTDKTWRSGNCPNVCVEDGRDNTGGGNGVGQCPDSDSEFYCISTGLGVENCTTGFDIIDFVGTLTALTTIGVAESTSSSASAESTSPSSASATNLTLATSATGSTGTGSAATATSTSDSDGDSESNGSSGGSSNKTAIGAGVGAGVGAIVVVAVLAFWLIRRRNKKRADSEAAASAAGFAGGAGGGSPPNMDKAPPGYAPTPNLGSPPAGYYSPSGAPDTMVPPTSPSPFAPSELYDSPAAYKASPAPQQQQHVSELSSTQADTRYEMA